MKRAVFKRSRGPECISSGSVLLDRVLGGGWALGRIGNLVGDKSTGKTLLAIETCANFAIKYDSSLIAYREIESAFDRKYAESMGLPKDIDYVDTIRTVEDLETDLVKWLERHSTGPTIYVVDSLDALSNEAELEREAGEASYGMEKAKLLSQLFRKRISAIEQAKCLVLIISQIRDKINVRFGETKTRSGGRALDFYASQVIWLAETGKIKRTSTKVERVVGVRVRAQNKKNKVGKPYRETGFTILFGYGIDDHVSMVDWLKENKGEEYLSEGLPAYSSRINACRKARDEDGLIELHGILSKAVNARWDEIEAAFEPPLSKYK